MTQNKREKCWGVKVKYLVKDLLKWEFSRGEPLHSLMFVLFHCPVLEEQTSSFSEEIMDCLEEANEVPLLTGWAAACSDTQLLHCCSGICESVI